MSWATRLRYGLARMFLKAGGLAIVPRWIDTTVLDPTWRALSRDGYRRNAAVYACVSTLAFDLVEPVLRCYNAQGEEMGASPLARLLSRPNPMHSQREFWTLCAVYAAVGGNAYIHVVRDRRGVPVELWPYHAGQMVPVPSTDASARMWISRYDYVNADGTEQPVPVEDVIQIRWPSVDLEQPWVALSPIVAVAAEVDATNEAMRYVRALLKNDAMPRVVLQTPAGLMLDDTAVNRMRAQWSERYGGDQRGGVAVLEEGVTLQRVGLSMSELAFDALMRVPEAHIAAAFRVPAIVAGLGIGLDRSTYSNYAEARVSYTQQTLIPLWRMWEGEIQSSLGDPFGVVVRYDLSNVAALQEDQAARVTRTINAWSAGIITRNEARHALMLPIDDAGDVYALPTSVQLLDAQHSPVIGMPTLTPTTDAPPTAADAPVETRAAPRAPHPIAEYVAPPIDDVAESMFRRLRRYVDGQYRSAAVELERVAQREIDAERARNVQ